MQYLLTEEEFNNLTKKATEAEDLPNKKDLQELCTLAANSIPLKSGWMKGKVWGCILTRSDWYCDECPARKVCPHPRKKWSQ